MPNSFQILINSSFIVNKMLLKYNINLFVNNNNFFYNESRIIMLKPGNYIFNLSCYFDQCVKLGLIINDKTIYEMDSQNNLINFHEIINTKICDTITIQNLSNYDIQILNHLNFPNNNLLKLTRIN